MYIFSVRNIFAKRVREFFGFLSSKNITFSALLKDLQILFTYDSFYFINFQIINLKQTRVPFELLKFNFILLHVYSFYAIVK